MGFIAIKCPQCGADIQLDDSREFGFCTYCGTKVMQEKIIVEHTGGVILDNTEKLKNLHILAERALSSSDNAKAREYFNEILVECPNDWKAVFYSVFLKKDSVAPIGDGYNIFYEQITSTVESAFDVITTLPENEQKDCCSVICNEINDYGTTILNFALKSENESVESLKKLPASNIRILTKKVAEGYSFAALIPCMCAVDLNNKFSNDTKEVITKLTFTGLRILNCSSRWFKRGGHNDVAINTMVSMMNFLYSINPEAADEIIEELPVSKG